MARNEHIRFRRALITGASSGIGAAFTQAVPAATDLMLVGRDQRRLDLTADSLARPGRTVVTVACDLACEHDVRRLIDTADAWGVDLLINNAGVGRLGRIVDNSLEDERATAAVNVVAVLLLTRGLVPGMTVRARAEGRRAGLVIVSSTAAFAAVPYFATYAASKAFDLSFAEALAEEMRGEPIDILALCPGATRTAFADRAGFRGRELPGAVDPATVAREALDALGRVPVKVTGVVDQTALSPVVLTRRCVHIALGAAMRLVNRSWGQLADPAPTRSRA